MHNCTRFWSVSEDPLKSFHTSSFDMRSSRVTLWFPNFALRSRTRYNKFVVKRRNWRVENENFLPRDSFLEFSNCWKSTRRSVPRTDRKVGKKKRQRERVVLLGDPVMNNPEEPSGFDRDRTFSSSLHRMRTIRSFRAIARHKRDRREMKSFRGKERIGDKLVVGVMVHKSQCGRAKSLPRKNGIINLWISLNRKNKETGRSQFILNILLIATFLASRRDGNRDHYHHRLWWN